MEGEESLGGYGVSFVVSIGGLWFYPKCLLYIEAVSRGSMLSAFVLA